MISSHFLGGDSDSGLRWAGFSKYLVRRGWDVHVLTADAAAGDRLWEGVQVHGCRLLGVRAGRQARELVRRFRPDVVVTSGPPHGAHLAGFLATVRTGIPLVLDRQAPWWSESDLGLGRARASALAGQASRVVENRLFHYARDVIANTGDLAAALSDQHPGTKVWLLPSGADLEELREVRPDPLPRLSITSAGTLRDPRAVDPVLRALRLFLDRVPEATRDSRLRIVGQIEHDCAARLTTRICDFGLESRVQVLGVAPRPRALELLAGSNVSVVIAQEHSLELAPWLYESISLGVPTLVCGDADSATAREARRLGAAVCEPEDIEGIERFVEQSWRGALQVGASAPGSIDYHHLAAALEPVLTNTAPRSMRLTGRRSTDDLPGTFELEGEPLANWLWLADPPGWDRALELTMGRPQIADALALRFAEVSVLDCSVALDRSPAALSGAGADDWPRLPYGDESFDFVAIHDVWTDLMHLGLASGTKPDVALLGECHRVLRPGGCLYVAAPNPRFRRLSVAAPKGQPARLSAAVGPMRRRLAGAGFSRRQAYYVTPSHSVPFTIMPATGPAVLRHQQLTTGASASEMLRRGLAAVGLHELLHPSVAYLANR